MWGPAVCLFSLCGLASLGSSIAVTGDTYGNQASDVSAEGVMLSSATGEPGLVLDGDRSTLNPLQCFKLAGNGPDLKLHVQLPGTTDVSFVLIYVNDSHTEEDVSNLSSDSRQRDTRLEVDVDDTLCARTHLNTSVDGRLSVVCTSPISGSRVVIRLPGENRSLRVCEVEVYDTKCDCLDGCHAHEKEACFAPCPREKCNRENVALARPAGSSPLVETSGPASLVVNGNTGTHFVSIKATTNVSAQNCIMTQSAMTSFPAATAPFPSSRQTVASWKSWWSVELDDETPVRGVVIYRANAEEEMRTDVVTEVTVDGERCARYSGSTLTPEEARSERLVVRCDRVIRGRRVKVARVREDAGPLQLCEVQIWNCKPGYYGLDCKSKCGHCIGSRDTCDSWTGLCVDGCQAGWFGAACTEPCGFCLNEACDVTTGVCPDGCRDGFLPPLCTTPVSYSTTSSTTTTTTAAQSSTDGDGVSTTAAQSSGGSSDAGDDGGSDAGVVAGAVVGVLVVVVAVAIFLVLWFRRRRGESSANKKEPHALPSHAGATVYTRKDTKQEVTQTDSCPYVEAMSPNITSGDPDVVTTDVTTSADPDGPIYDVITEGKHNTYDSLQRMTYQNAVDADDDHHHYVTPVFRRGTSQTSNTSGGYVDMGANIYENNEV